MGDEVTAKPKIDDQYWFNYSEQLLTNAAIKPEKAVETLQKLAIWFWGIYTASAAIGFALSEKKLPVWVTFLIASASVSIIAVYWGTVWIQMPHLGSFDPRSPDQIREAYNSSIKVKNRRLIVTVALSIIAAILVSFSIVFASLSEEYKIVDEDSQAIVIGPGFDASVHSTDEGKILALTGKVGITEKVTVYIKLIQKSKSKEKSHTYIIIPSDKGLIQTSLPIGEVKSDKSEVEVTLEWKDSEGMKIQLSRLAEIKIKQQ